MRVRLFVVNVIETSCGDFPVERDLPFDEMEIGNPVVVYTVRAEYPLEPTYTAIGKHFRNRMTTTCIAG